MISKTLGQRLHAKKRALERYGLEVTTSELKEISRRIEYGKEVVFVQKETNRISIWRLIFKGINVRVAYDRMRANVASFLPPH